MATTFGERLKHAWNAFRNRDPTENYSDQGMTYTYRPDRPRMTRGNERSIVTAIYNRIALDVSSLTFKHCKLDDTGRYLSEVDSDFNKCLNIEANIDQTGRAFITDLVLSMLDEGVVAAIPIDTAFNPNATDSYKILTMRTGKIIEWMPSFVKVQVYNDRTGRREDIVVPKSRTAIIENPFFAVMNEPNSTMQRLIRKINLLDYIDEQSGAGKLDLIIQLPYVIKTDARKKQAEDRRKDIEMQLAGSKYGIAYTDGTERITQLNRPVENNLMKQIEYLTNMLYGQLNMSQSILDGTADAKTMQNYYSRLIDVIATAIIDEFKRKFLTKTARTQKQSVKYFRDPFKLASLTDIADAADKFTRNEILSSNEIRQGMGIEPSSDPKADQLRNSNMPQEDGGMATPQVLVEPKGQGNEDGSESGDISGADIQAFLGD